MFCHNVIASGMLAAQVINDIKLLRLHPFNGLFSRTTWVSRKAESLRILTKQVMMGWQWHQLDHMQIVCTSLQT